MIYIEDKKDYEDYKKKIQDPNTFTEVKLEDDLDLSSVNISLNNCLLYSDKEKPKENKTYLNVNTISSKNVKMSNIRFKEGVRFKKSEKTHIDKIISDYIGLINSKNINLKTSKVKNIKLHNTQKTKIRNIKIHKGLSDVSVEISESGKIDLEKIYIEKNSKGIQIYNSDPVNIKKTNIRQVEKGIEILKNSNRIDIKDIFMENIEIAFKIEELQDKDIIIDMSKLHDCDKIANVDLDKLNINNSPQVTLEKI